MKKKVLIGVLAVCLIVALVSCDDASFEKLGQLMGGMGNNIYGMTPNMEEVAAVSDTINSSVSEEEDGSIKIDLTTASTIIEKLAEIGTSDKKVEQVKEDLSKPITEDKTKSADIKSALETKLNAVKDSLQKTGATSTITDEKVKDAVDQVSSALDTIINSIPEEPTKADLATVVIINSLSEKVKDLSEKDFESSTTEEKIPLVNEALAALDALKVIPGVSDLDIVTELNLTSLLPSLSSESTSKAMADDEIMKYVKELQGNLIKFVSLFADKNDAGVYVYNKAKYQRLILQMTAIRTSYEVASLGLMPSINVKLLAEDENGKTLYDKLSAEDSGIGDIEIFKGLEEDFSKAEKTLKDNKVFKLNDLVTYLLSVAVTELDEHYSDLFDTTGNKDMEAILTAFLKDNENNLNQATISSLDLTAFELKENIEAEDEVVEALCKDAISISRTVFVIALESGFYDTVFSLATKGAEEEITVDKFLSNKIHELVKEMQ